MPKFISTGVCIYKQKFYVQDCLKLGKKWDYETFNLTFCNTFWLGKEGAEENNYDLTFKISDIFLSLIN